MIKRRKGHPFLFFIFLDVSFAYHSFIIFRKGVKLVKTPRGVSNNLPKQPESNVAHVRPHAKDGLDKSPLPNGRMMTKQRFWLNNSYIEKQIN